MNTQASPLWTDASTRARMTGTWRSATPVYRNIASPCLGACPVGGRIAEWIGQIEARDYHGAWMTLTDNNPFPAISGRICHHPCETACNRRQLDETVGICSLERFVGDMALSEGWKFPAPKAEQAASVAIIGAGPAGLSAAYQLRRAGVRVSMYEGRDQPGGLLRYGIPAYRLDRAVLDREIARILEMGITLELNTEIADAAALRTLRGAHDAVFLATGASLPKTLPTLDYDQPWVVESADFLAATNVGKSGAPGAHILVIGGGSAAMDVARTARRLGRNVTVLALEPEDSLPAQRAEVIEAKQEGVAFVTGAMLKSVRAGADGLTLDCTRVDFKSGEAGREFSVTPIASSEFTLKGDAIVPAIGQNVDLNRWHGAIAADGPVLKTDENWQTGMDGVFTGGDVAGMDRFVTKAVGMGKEAAVAILAYINTTKTLQKPIDTPEAPYEVINTAYHPCAARIRPGITGVEVRLGNFDEVQHPLDENGAMAEASRCFSCGICTLCDNCYFYCPDMAITRTGQGYEVNTDYCKGCGLCVVECPTGAIAMTKDLVP